MTSRSASLNCSMVMKCRVIALPPSWGSFAQRARAARGAACRWRSAPTSRRLRARRAPPDPWVACRRAPDPTSPGRRSCGHRDRSTAGRRVVGVATQLIDVAQQDERRRRARSRRAPAAVSALQLRGPPSSSTRDRGHDGREVRVPEGGDDVGAHLGRVRRRGPRRHRAASPTGPEPSVPESPDAHETVVG